MRSRSNWGEAQWESCTAPAIRELIERLPLRPSVFLAREPKPSRNIRSASFWKQRTPRIVTIFDVAEDPNTLTSYIVMEYVAGRSLEQMLRAGNGRLPLDTALQLAQELA